MRLIRNKKVKERNDNGIINIKNKYIVELDEDEYIKFQSDYYKLYCTPCHKALNRLNDLEEILDKYKIYEPNDLDDVLKSKVLDINTIKDVISKSETRIGLLYPNVNNLNAVIREFESLGYGLIPDPNKANLRFVFDDQNVGPIILYINTVNHTVIKYIQQTKYSVYLTLNELALVVRLYQLSINI